MCASFVWLVHFETRLASPVCWDLHSKQSSPNLVHPGCCRFQNFAAKPRVALRWTPFARVWFSSLKNRRRRNSCPHHSTSFRLQPFPDSVRDTRFDPEWAQIPRPSIVDDRMSRTKNMPNGTRTASLGESNRWKLFFADISRIVWIYLGIVKQLILDIFFRFLMDEFSCCDVKLTSDSLLCNRFDRRAQNTMSAGRMWPDKRSNANTIHAMYDPIPPKCIDPILDHRTLCSIYIPSEWKMDIWKNIF